MRAIVLAAVGMALAGCGGSAIDPIQTAAIQASQHRDSGVAECNRKYPDPQKKPITPLIRCAIDAQMEWHLSKARTVGHPSLDYIRMNDAQILAAADRYDRGKISFPEFQAEATKAYNASKERIDSDEAARMAAHNQQAAAQQARGAALFQQGAAIMAGPPTVRCDHFGNSTTCRQW